MIKYWYCGNIPPRPLDEKVEDLESWNGQDEKKNLWTNQRLRKNNLFLKQKISQDVGGGV
jgi:hypothetical protein